MDEVININYRYHDSKTKKNRADVLILNARLCKKSHFYTVCPVAKRLHGTLILQTHPQPGGKSLTIYFTGLYVLVT